MMPSNPPVVYQHLFVLKCKPKKLAQLPACPIMHEEYFFGPTGRAAAIVRAKNRDFPHEDWTFTMIPDVSWDLLASGQ